MEVASPLPFPPQAGTKRPFVFSPPGDSEAAAAAAAGCGAMEHDSSEPHHGWGADRTDTFGQAPPPAAKRRRRFSGGGGGAADENAVNGSSFSSFFPAFAAAAPGGGFPAPKAAAAVPPHGIGTCLRFACLGRLVSIRVSLRDFSY